MRNKTIEVDVFGKKVRVYTEKQKDCEHSPTCASCRMGGCGSLRKIAGNSPTF